MRLLFSSILFLLYASSWAATPNAFVIRTTAATTVTVTIQAGAVLTIQGSFINRNGPGATVDGYVNNQGSITVTEDWTNNASHGSTVFNTSAGRVYFIGTVTTQSITGSATTSFYELRTNNTFAAGPQITLGINTTVANSLVMLSGVIDLGSNTLTLGTDNLKPGTLTHAGTAAAGYFINTTGAFKRWLDNNNTIVDGDIAGLYPMGSYPTGASPFLATDYRPLYISWKSVLGTYAVSHVDASTYSITAIPDGGFTIQRVDNAYWNVVGGDGMDDVSGDLYTMSAQRTYAAGAIGALTDLRLTTYTVALGTHPATNSGTVLVPVVRRDWFVQEALSQGSHQFHIGTIDSMSSPLPIELVRFDAQLNFNRQVDLTWTTASETNNDFFTVERTKDGNAFETFAIVDGAGAGTNSGTLNYKTIDKNPLCGISYYRLKQTDFDGNKKYSYLVAVDLNNATNPTIEVFANIYNNQDILLQIKGIHVNTPLQIEIYQANGQRIFSEEIHIESQDENITRIDLSDKLAPGLYLVTLTNAAERSLVYKQKIIITN